MTKEKIISFPHLGDYSYFVKPFIRNITNLKVRLAPPITKKTIELGSKYSPDFICLPFKYNLGNYIEALEGGANILFQFGGGCRYGNYAETQKTILKDLNYKFEFYEFIKKGKTSFNHIFKVFKNLNPKLTRRVLVNNFIIVFTKIILLDKLEDYRRKKVELDDGEMKKLKYSFIEEVKDEDNIFKIFKIYYFYRRRYKKVKCVRPKLKIGIIGELYTAMEPFSTHNLEDELKKYGVSVKRFTDVSYLLLYKKLVNKFIRFRVKDYAKYNLGADATDNIYRTMLLKRKKYDGIIHTKPFGCTPEVGVMPILNKVGKDKNIPIMYLSFDVQTASAGIKTRIEAFIDMLLMRKDKK